VRVRRASRTPIDRDLIAKTDSRRARLAGNGPITDVMAYESERRSYAFSPDSANRLLDEAGWAAAGPTARVEVRKDQLAFTPDHSGGIHHSRERGQRFSVSSPMSA
jgi:ABC-type transport system substrate-binding protein